jgi:hypothetical protein
LITPHGFTDVLPAASAYYAKFRDRLSPGEDDTPRAIKITQALGWRSALNLVSRVKAMLPVDVVESDVQVFGLNSGAVLQWGRDEAAPKGADRFIVPIYVGPGCVLHVAGASAPLIAGQVLSFNPRNLYSAANFGPVQGVIMAMYLRNPSQEDEDELPDSDA